ncbi:MAD-domain-containing protein [Cylindrobasidium torrendii FP15055 ss-10]|uniref:Spindle assembly checkpoint component MAD1 n=1 Tax=Cylindrobasidium torrendii FP15055 ss-10 TaxID=1314674 RepID=A0A0D7BE06_9AGAR|nr:MAD-domain-containing protein [Cylindrobasidium torrendii FP15055 ss-10]
MHRSGASSSSTRAPPKRDARTAELEPSRQLYATKKQALTSSMATGALERQVAKLQAAKLELETKLREKETTVDQLERDRRWLADRETEEREEKELQHAEHEREKKRLESEMRALRASVAALKEEKEDLEEAHSNLQRTSSQAQSTQRTQISQLSREVKYLSEELAQAKSLANERQNSLDTVRAEFEELSLNQSRPQEDTNMVVIREELHRQAAYLRQLESTNSKLKAEIARNGNVDLLREEKRTMERRARQVEPLQERVAELEGQLSASRAERQDWANKSLEMAQSPGRTSVSQTQLISDLRLAQAKALEQAGATAALLRTKEIELADAEQREEQALGRIKSLESEIRALDGRKHQVALLEREVGFLKALVASFEAEDETVGDDRFAELEGVLSDYKDTNTGLLRDLESLRLMAPQEDLDKEKQSSEALKTALEQAETQCAEQEKKIDALEQELFELSGEIAGGRHVPPGTRILQLADNPLQQWVDIREEVVQRLRKENDALIQRLAEVEQRAGPASANASQDPGMVPRESWELISQEKQALQEEVKKREKRLLRLQQVFASKSQEFREAIESILGVRLAFYQNGQVRVTSSFDLRASFVFSPGAGGGGKMQLVAHGDGVPEDLERIMRYWVGEEQCIPAFMATVTMESFETSKMRNEGDMDS